MAKYLAILNLNSSRLDNDSVIGSLLRAIFNAKVKFQIEISKYQGHINEIIYDHQDELEILALAGGDGSINEASQSLTIINKRRQEIGMEPIKLLYFPTGTTCDFAKSLNLPEDFQKIINYFNNDKYMVQAIDVTSFKGSNNFISNFVYVAACGALTSTSYMTSTESKKRLGHMAYMITGITELTKLSPFDVEIEIDGEKIVLQLIFLALSNSFSIAGLIQISDSMAKLNDGEIELLLLQEPDLPIMRFAKLAQMAIKPLDENSEVIIIKSKNIKLKFKEAIDWTLDGEFANSHKEVEIKVLPSSLFVLVPC